MRVISTTERTLDFSIAPCTTFGVSTAGCGVTPSGAAKVLRAVLLQLLRVGEARRGGACRASESELRLTPSRTLIVPSLVDDDVAVGGLSTIGPPSPSTWSPALVTSSPCALICSAPLRV